ncbi:ABC transporter substrate-binding protein [Sporomusa sphaeroides]|uniref:Bicarbonate transport ATP-binding protein CmpC n=1 Tax=Sporomusa sphaeroides DSM 2875 TaxID=1337886 RepID=A0ABM9W9S2_9FIRM|nr:ABC transporter substrate-binding protein [Sporomusa sphaeroides]OLS57283.1 bicarbonate transport ATP-binding protein CmpC [Sporomusa sphaeroides DSM 2875]CVK21888.1 Bicarbonate transport ATP-binding protein CmpC [Sporomusa sphaeroides DSM 2875]
MNRREFIKKSVFMTVGLVGGLTLAGCGSTTETGRASNQGKNKPTIKIGYLPITDHLTMIAHGQMEFRQFTLEPVKFSGWAELAEALKGNAIQGAFALTPIGMSLKQKGVPVKAVFLGHRNGSVLTAKNIPELNKIEDLRGKTIAIPSRFSTHNVLIHKVLTEKGINPNSEVKFIDMSPPEMVNALSTGKIDAFIVAEPFGGQAEMQKVGKVLVLSKDIWHDHICCVLNMQEEVVQKQPEAVEELVGGLAKAAAFIDNNPQEAAKLSLKYLGQKQEVVEHVLTNPKGRITFNNLVPDIRDFAATEEYLLQFGITKDKIDLAQYIDDRFAKKAFGV